MLGSTIRLREIELKFALNLNSMKFRQFYYKFFPVSHTPQTENTTIYGSVSDNIGTLQQKQK